MKSILIVLLIVITSNLYSQNEFYINENALVSLIGSDSANPTLFVKGNLINDDGEFINDSSKIELTGNWSNNPITGRYESTGKTIFSGTSNQFISGTMNGTTDSTLNSVVSGVNQFYKIDFNSTSTVTLANDVHVHTDGIATFTDTATTVVRDNGSNEKFYIRNSDPSSLIGYGSTGATSKFFTSALWRESVNGTTYDLPVGYSSAVSTATGEGVQMASVAVTGASGNGAIESKFTFGSPSTTPIIICPGAPTIEAKDVDEILDNGFWTISNSDANISEYALTLDPADYTPLFGPGDYTILQNGGPTGMDPCDGVITGLAITHATLASFSKFEIGASTDGAPLPVELLSLTAYPVNNNFIRVDWSTATEINNDGFEVERSINGIDFQNIGWVQGNGFSNIINEYIYDDYNVNFNQLYYYRLKQIDFNGDYEYTYIVSAMITKDGNAIMATLYPNPTSGNSVLAVNVTKDQKGTIRLYDMIGKLISNRTVEILEGKNEYIIQTNTLSDGTYHVNLEIENQVINIKLIVAKK